MSVLAPTGELLFFVWAKKSNQKKAHQTGAWILRPKAFAGGWRGRTGKTITYCVTLLSYKNGTPPPFEA